MTWYISLFLATGAICIVFVYYSIDMLDGDGNFQRQKKCNGWLQRLFAGDRRCTRRTGGGVVTIIIVIFAVYPLVAGSMPGVLEGTSESTLGYGCLLCFPQKH